MKLGCSSSSYHAAFRAGRLDQREWLRLCAENLEVDGVELVDMHFPTTDRAYLRQLKKQCVDLGLTVAGIAVSNDFGPDDRRPQEIEKVCQWTEVAAYIGAPVVRVFAGTPAAPAAIVPEAEEGRIVGALRKVFGQPQPNTRRAWSDAASALRRCADYASERVVVVGLQNSARGLVSTQPELAQCLRDVGSPWLRVCLDPADLPGSLDAWLPGVVQVRARMRDVGDDGGDATTPWRHVTRQLNVARYRGFVLLDYEGSEAPEMAVPRAVRYLRDAIQSLNVGRPTSSPSDANGTGGGSSIRDSASTPRDADEPR